MQNSPASEKRIEHFVIRIAFLMSSYTELQTSKTVLFLVHPVGVAVKASNNNCSGDLACK